MFSRNYGRGPNFDILFGFDACTIATGSAVRRRFPTHSFEVTGPRTNVRHAGSSSILGPSAASFDYFLNVASNANVPTCDTREMLVIPIKASYFENDEYVGIACASSIGVLVL